MTDDQAINVAWFATALLLVVSALVSRRMATGAWLRMAAMWAAVIGIVWVAALLLSRFLNLPHFT